MDFTAQQSFVLAEIDAMLVAFSLLVVCGGGLICVAWPAVVSRRERRDMINQIRERGGRVISVHPDGDVSDIDRMIDALPAEPCGDPTAEIIRSSEGMCFAVVTADSSQVMRLGHEWLFSVSWPVDQRELDELLRVYWLGHSEGEQMSRDYVRSFLG